MVSKELFGLRRGSAAVGGVGRGKARGREKGKHLALQASFVLIINTLKIMHMMVNRNSQFPHHHSTRGRETAKK